MDHKPAEGRQPRPTFDILLPAAYSEVVLLTVALDGNHEVRICKVDPSDLDAVLITDDELSLWLRKRPAAGKL